MRIWLAIARLSAWSAAEAATITTTATAQKRMRVVKPCGTPIAQTTQSATR